MAGSNEVNYVDIKKSPLIIMAQWLVNILLVKYEW